MWNNLDILHILSKKNFDNKFKPIFREIEYIKLKLPQQQGFWIFKSHRYTVEELLESSHFCKIDSIIGKIGDDVINWEQQNKLSFFDKQIYSENREKVDDELHELKKEIIQRQPTWWEKIQGIFDKYIDIVMDKLPDFTNSFLPIVLRGITSQLLGTNKNRLRLPQINK